MKLYRFPLQESFIPECDGRNGIRLASESASVGDGGGDARTLKA